MKGRDVILGLLMKQSMSGYDIKQYFESIFTYFFDASYGTIYPTLNQLQKEGYIDKDTVIQEGKPNKNVYTITDKGRKWFYDYLNSPVEQDTYRSDFLMRMYFGEYANEDQLVQWLEDAIVKTQKNLRQLENDYEKWKTFMSPSQEICIQVGISANKAQLETLLSHLKRFKPSIRGKEEEHESL